MFEIDKRLREIQKHYNLKSYAQFAELVGISHQTASNYLKGKQKPDFQKIALILQSFDKIDANWLILGKGEMFLTQKATITDENLTDLIKLQREKIQSLEKEILRLKKDKRASYTNS